MRVILTKSYLVEKRIKDLTKELQRHLFLNHSLQLNTLRWELQVCILSPPGNPRHDNTSPLKIHVLTQTWQAGACCYQDATEFVDSRR